MSDDNNGLNKYVAVFNISEKEMDVNINELSGLSSDGEEIWSGVKVTAGNNIRIAKHGAVLVKMGSC